MGVREYFATLKEFIGVLRNRRVLAPRPLDTIDSVGLKVEETAARFGERTMILFEGRQITWSEFNELANRYAHALKSRGIGHGDIVSLMMENRIEFLAALVAVSQTRRGGVADQHQSARAAADALCFGHPIEGVDIRRRTQPTPSRRQSRSAAAGRQPPICSSPTRARPARRTGPPISARKRMPHASIQSARHAEDQTRRQRNVSSSRPARPVCRKRRWFRIDGSSAPAPRRGGRPQKQRKRPAVPLPAAVSRHGTDGRASARRCGRVRRCSSAASSPHRTS